LGNPSALPRHLSPAPAPYVNVTITQPHPKASPAAEVEPYQNRGGACPRPNLTSSLAPRPSQQPRAPHTSAVASAVGAPPAGQSPSASAALRPPSHQFPTVVYAQPPGAAGRNAGPRYPQHQQQGHLVRCAARPPLQHYDSIQELYSFVSNVLSSWENRAGGGDDASSTASGIPPNQFNGGRHGESIPSGNSSVAGSTVSSSYADGRRFPGAHGQGLPQGRGQQDESTYYATLSHYNLTGTPRGNFSSPAYPRTAVRGGLSRGGGVFAPVIRYRHPESASATSLPDGGGPGGQYYTAAVPAAGSNNTYFYQESVCPSAGQPQEEPISRPVSNLSNKSSEQYYTYPYPRKQQELILRSPDWATVINWARRVVQSREDENATRCDCSHEFHDVRGLQKHEHSHSWPHVQPQECNVLFLAKVKKILRF